jgi:hypothetical protein
MSQRLHDLAGVQEVRPVGRITEEDRLGPGGGGAADCAGPLAGIGKAGLSLVPTSPSRRAFEFTLGSDNQSSSTRARKNRPGGA